MLPEVLPDPDSDRAFSGFAALSHSAFTGCRRSAAGLSQGTERNHNPRVGGSSPSSATRVFSRTPIMSEKLATSLI